MKEYNLSEFNKEGNYDKRNDWCLYKSKTVWNALKNPTQRQNKRGYI